MIYRLIKNESAFWRVFKLLTGTMSGQTFDGLSAFSCMVRGEIKIDRILAP